MSAKPEGDYTEIKLGEYTKRLKLTNRAAKQLEKLQGVSIFCLGNTEWLGEHAGLGFISDAIYCGLLWADSSKDWSPDRILDLMDFTKIYDYIFALKDMFDIYGNGGIRPKEETKEPEEAEEVKNDEEPTEVQPPVGESLQSQP